jgi:hypothetical protein
MKARLGIAPVAPIAPIAFAPVAFADGGPVPARAKPLEYAKIGHRARARTLSAAGYDITE